MHLIVPLFAFGFVIVYACLCIYRKWSLWNSIFFIDLPPIKLPSDELHLCISMYLFCLLCCSNSDLCLCLYLNCLLGWTLNATLTFILTSTQLISDKLQLFNDLIISTTSFSLVLIYWPLHHCLRRKTSPSSWSYTYTPDINISSTHMLSSFTSLIFLSVSYVSLFLSSSHSDGRV